MTPRHADRLLHVILLGRVSTENQEESNIEAGYEYARPVLKQVYDGPTLVKELGEVASGMRTDRPTILEALALIEQGWPDLVLMEDLSKAYRNPAFQLGFVQNCVDKRIRLIAVGDNLDTWDENWEIALAAATLQHGTHIPHTRRRVRRSATAAFHAGGMVLRVRAGYRKLTKEEAATGQFGPKGLRIATLLDWSPTVDHVRRMILDQVLPSPYLRLDHVVDWMNGREVPTGPYCKRKTWTVQLLVEWLRDPILCGWRRHRQTIYEYVYGDGSRQ
jgi:DNA invertase Pin-like site-specific DNA recombinase